jgi:hypothetical protein
VDRRLPFPPREGWPDASAHAASAKIPVVTINGPRDVWRALEIEFGLTFAGRAAVLLVLVAGVALLGLGLVGSERDGGNPMETGVALIGSVLTTAVLLAIVFALDVAFRRIRRLLR